MLWVHLPVSLAILAVNRAGAPCPLTELELWLRSEAGGAAYDGGYLGHYVFSPMGLDAASPSVQAGVYTVAIVPNAVALGAARGPRAPNAPAACARDLIRQRASAASGSTSSAGSGIAAISAATSRADDPAPCR